MADSSAEIDLDSVIDRLLEGAHCPVATQTGDDMLRSARKSARKGCTIARIRDQIPLHEGARDLHWTTHPARAGGADQDMW